MDEFVQFFAKFGLPITLIAFAGIAILGIMKYCDLFTCLQEQTRHFVYVGISAGLSIIGSNISWWHSDSVKTLSGWIRPF